MAHAASRVPVVARATLLLQVTVLSSVFGPQFSRVILVIRPNPKENVVSSLPAATCPRCRALAAVAAPAGLNH